MIEVLWFSSENCRACISFLPHWKELTLKYDKINFRKICVDDEPNTVREYNIVYYPTFLFSHNDTLFEKRVIGADKQELEKELMILNAMI